MHHVRTLRPTLVVLACLVATLLPAVAGGAQTTTSDTISIAKQEDNLANADVAVALSEVTPFEEVRRVVIGRDDVFADSLASGVLQADAPLLLVPPGGPLPPAVRDELARLGPEEVVLLGGTGAISPAVEAELAAAGYGVQRRAGASRFETAVAVATTDAPSADTVIIARAFASPGATDPTQEFADALAAGYMAAENGWPVLLTQTEVLTGSTRDYLAASGASHAVVLGGEAAVGPAVVAELQALGLTVERLQGANRFETAVAVAEKVGADSAADAAQVVVVEGQAADAWAGGFAAAAHAAHFDAPIVLSNGDDLPQATEAWLRSTDFAVVPDDPAAFPVLTCVTLRSVCEEARVAVGLPPAAVVTTVPAEGSAVSAGQQVAFTVTGTTSTSVEVGGSCLPGPVIVPLDGGQGAVRLATSLPAGSCDLTFTLALPNGATQTTTVTFTTGAAVPQLLSVGPAGGAVGGELPSTDAAGQLVAFVSDGAVLDDVGEGERRTYVVDTATGETVLLDRRPGGTPAPQGVEHVEGPPDVAAGGGHVAFIALDGALDSDGATSAQSANGYVRTLAAGTTQLVTLDLLGEPAEQARAIQVSGDGTVVSYRARTGEGTTGLGILHHDLSTGQVDAVRLPGGAPYVQSSGSVAQALSADGRWIAFYAQTALLPEDTNGTYDAYVYDRETGELELVSVTPQGVAGQGTTIDPSQIDISADGRFVVFVSGATDLVPGDAGGGDDIFLRDREAGTTQLLSRRLDGTAANGARHPSISPDGAFVAFSSGVDLTGSGDDHAQCGVYRWDAASGQLTRLDPPPLTTGPANCPTRTAVDVTGGVVSDVWRTFDPSDAEPGPDIYRFTG